MSELRADTITASDGTSPVTLTKQSAAKAWCSWDMSNTNTIENSFGVASLSDDGIGTNGINLSSAMSGANDFCVTTSFYQTGNSNVLKVASAPTASKIVVIGGQYQIGSTNVPVDFDLAYAVINGDLA